MSSEIFDNHPPSSTNRVWFVLSYLPILLVALTFATHAVMGLSGSADLRDIVSVLGFGSTITALLVFFTGLHDGTVTAFVLAKDKLAPDLAWSRRIHLCRDMAYRSSRSDLAVRQAV